MQRIENQSRILLNVEKLSEMWVSKLEKLEKSNRE